MSKSNVDYLTEKLVGKRIFTRKDVVRTLIITDQYITSEIQAINETMKEIVESQEYTSSDPKTQKKMLKASDDRLTSETRRQTWFQPFKNAGINDTKIVDLLFKLFKSKDILYHTIFGDLYSLAKVHRIVTGVVSYTPADAHTNILALVEFIVECDGRNFKNGEFFRFYNTIKIERYEDLIRRGIYCKKVNKDTTLTQTGKIFRSCARLGIGSLSGSPDSKKNPCTFTINWSSVLLAEIASKPSQKALLALINANTSKVQ